MATFGALRHPWNWLLHPYRTHVLCPPNLCPNVDFPDPVPTKSVCPRDVWCQESTSLHASRNAQAGDRRSYPAKPSHEPL